MYRKWRRAIPIADEKRIVWSASRRLYRKLIEEGSGGTVFQLQTKGGCCYSLKTLFHFWSACCFRMRRFAHSALIKKLRANVLLENNLLLDCYNCNLAVVCVSWSFEINEYFIVVLLFYYCIVVLLVYYCTIVVLLYCCIILLLHYCCIIVSYIYRSLDKGS